MGNRQEDQNTPSQTGLVSLQVQLRPEHVRQLQRLAAQEGATPEAFAALLIEEKLDEASRSAGNNVA